MASGEMEAWIVGELRTEGETCVDRDREWLIRGVAGVRAEWREAAAAARLNMARRLVEVRAWEDMFSGNDKYRVWSIGYEWIAQQEWAGAQSDTTTGTLVAAEPQDVSVMV